MKKVLKTALVGIAVLALSACAGVDTSRMKETIGTALGGVGGAVVGAQFGGGTGKLVAVAAGTLVGAFIGNQVGITLDRADSAALSSATQVALETRPTSEALPWQGEQASGYVIPTKTYQATGGAYCREFTQKVRVGGKEQDAFGTACRQSDGNWKISA